jgi:hypothetical protein
MAVDSASSQPDQTTYDEARNGAVAYLQSRLATKDRITDDNFQIPVIVLTPSFSFSLPSRQAVAAQIRDACTTSGFFYITNHNIPASACDGILHQAERFMHELPLDKKEELHLKHNGFGLGWEPSEYTSIAGDKEEKEVFNFAYEAALDRTGGDSKYTNLDGSTGKANLWPHEEDLPRFYGEVKEYYGAVSVILRIWKCARGLTYEPGPRSSTPPLPPLCPISRLARGLLRHHDHASGWHSTFAVLSTTQEYHPLFSLVRVRCPNRSRGALRLRMLHPASNLHNPRSRDPETLRPMAHR